MFNQTSLESILYGDDLTDYTAALQAYINTHALTRLGAGVYKFGNLTLPAGHRLVGAGEKTTLKQIAGGVGVTVNSNCAIDALRIQSANTQTTKAIRGENAKLVKLRDVSIDGLTPGVGQNYSECGVEIVSSGGDNSYGWALENCHVQRSRGAGLKLVGGCAAVHVYGGRIQANDGYGVYAAAPGQVELSLRDVIVEGNAQGAAYVDNWFASEVTSCHFENSANQVTPLLRCGIGGACTGLRITNNSFGCVLAPYAMDFSGAGASVGVNISVNVITSAQIAAIYAYKLWDAHILDNECTVKHLALKDGSQCRNVLLKIRDEANYFSTGSMPRPKWNVGEYVA